MSDHLVKHWYRNGPVAFLLLPVSWLYSWLAKRRRQRLEKTRQPLFSNRHVPVIVVGNITVGGTGKTPMVIWLAQSLKAQGYHPGVVSRGYGGAAISQPLEVTSRSDARDVGDEALVMAKGAACPVWVCRHRREAIQSLVQSHPRTDVIISDDGLQHYLMPRDIEIVMIDGARRFGNGLCLPAGPLREPLKRLQEVDFRVVKGTPSEPGEYGMAIGGEVLVNLKAMGRRCPLQDLKGQTVHAVAGLGNPQLFFDKLSASGLTVIPHVFRDHHRYTLEDVSFDDDLAVIMTEKDAVKCGVFAERKHWYLPVKAHPDADFFGALRRRLKEFESG